MLLNSHSSSKKNSYSYKPMKCSSNKREIQKNIKYQNQNKKQNYISQFQINPLNKNNGKELNSIFKNKPLKEEKFPENVDENSTFIFTGDNTSCADNNKIIQNYLKKPLVRPIFDSNSISTILNKEENEIKSSKENSFSLSSSKTCLDSKKNASKKNMKNNQKLMTILKELNSSNSTTEKTDKNNLKKDNNKIIKENNKKDKLSKLPNNTTEKLQRKRKNKIEKEIKTKRMKTKLLYFVLFVCINIVVYYFLFINLFEPSVEGLFFDNDHNNYKYCTSLLSQDRSLVMNK